MTHTELQSIQKEIKFDCPSMAAVLGMPYNTYKNYYYNCNAIPEQIARKVLEIKQINITFMEELPARVDDRVSRQFPFGFLSATEAE